MKVIVDRFEGDFAVVEVDAGVMVDMPKILLPEGVREGDVVSICIDLDATKIRGDKVNKLVDGLWM